MHRIRIIRIQGKTAAERAERLQAVRGWMEAFDWRLGDYAKGPSTAMFEHAGRLPFWHPTCWLPGPRALHPRQWWRTLRADPRTLALPVGLVAVLWLLVVGIVIRPDLGRLLPEGSPLEQAQELVDEDWRYVNASVLNVRARPEGGSPIMGILYRSQRVQVVRESEGWAELSHPERGFVSTQFLSETPPQ